MSRGAPGGDTVRIRFEAALSEELDRAILNKGTLLKEVRDRAVDAGLSLNQINAFVPELEKRTLPDLKAFAERLRDIEAAAAQTQRTLAGMRGPSMTMVGGGGAASWTNPNSLNTGAAPGAAYPVDVSEADVHRATEARVAFARQMRRVSQETDGATKSTQGLHGVTLIGTTALRQMGVEGARGIEVVARSLILLKEEGKSLEQILQSKLLGFTGLAVAAILLVKSIKEVSDSAREFEETYLKVVERTNRVSLIGQTGGTDQLQTDLKKLQDAKRDIQYLLGEGQNRDRAADVARDVGGGAKREELNRLEYEFGKAVKEAREFRLGNLFLLTSDQSEKEKKVNDLMQQLANARGSYASPDLIARRTAEVTAEFDKFQVHLHDVGEKDNIFDRAYESLRRLAEETNRQKDLKAFIDDLIKRSGGTSTFVPEKALPPLLPGGSGVTIPAHFDFQPGTLSLEEINNEVKKFKEGLEDSHEAQQRMSKLNERLREAFAKVNAEIRLRDQATRQLAQIERQVVSDSPMEKALQAALTREEQFREKFSTLPGYMYDRMKEASDRLLGLEIFRGGLTEALGLEGLRTELDKLGSGLFGNDEDRSEGDRQELAYGRYQDLQYKQFGSWRERADAEYVASNALGSGGKEDEMLAKARVARDNNRYEEAAKFEVEARAERRKDALRDFGRDALDSQLDVLKGALSRAPGPQEQRFALDQILSLTHDLGKLTEGERDLRLKALQQRLQLGESERSRVLIEIRNGAPDVARTTVERLLGPEPSPAGAQAEAFDPLQGGF